MTTATLLTDRAVAAVTIAFSTLEGEGFPVRRALPAQGLEAVGPFIFLDQFGPLELEPGEAKGAPAHPHAGIETLTLLLEGRFAHKDSLGNASAMEPGEVQWMRAGRGIVHDEGPDAEIRRNGGRVHGVQLWLNMPAGDKHDAPAYRHVRAREIPQLRSADGRVTTRVIAGAIGGAIGPVRTAGAPLAAHVSFGGTGGETVLEIANARELAVYVMTGEVQIGADRRTVPGGGLARLQSGDVVRLAAAGPAEVLVIGGDRLDAPIVRYGPFVMNSAEQLNQAMRDYQSGRMGEIAA